MGSLYVRPSTVCPISMKFGVYIEVDEWCTRVCHMTRSKVKVKVKGLLKFWKLHFSKSISCTIYNGSWQMTTDSLSTISEFARAGFFDICPSLWVTWPWLGGVPAVSPPRKKVLRFKLISVCGQRLMTDAPRYAVWHDQGQGPGHKCLKATQEESTVSPTRV